MANIKAIQAFEGDYNGVYQKFWAAQGTNNNIYTTQQLEYTEKNGVKVVDAELTQWKPISNEAHARIDDEMYMKEIVKNEVVGEVLPTKPSFRR